MEKKFIATGKDFDAAKRAGLEQLGLDEDQVTILVLEREKKGVFGFGAKPCKVEITYEVPDAKPATALSSASRSKPKTKPETAKVQEPAFEAPKPVRKAEPPKPVKKPEAPKPERKPEPKPERKAEPPKPVRKMETEIPQIREPKVYVPAPEGSIEQSIETFLGGLMKHMGSDAVAHAVKDGENSYHVELVGKDLGMLIGRRGETLDAIQHLANYSVNRPLETHVRISVDAEDYRVKREESLRRYARKKAQQVLKAHRRTTLEPMNAYERHVIHAALQDMENITTYSTGTEPNRRVTIEFVR